MARGVDGRVIYVDDLDKRCFLNDLNEVFESADADLSAYCLMGNHFHLAVQVRDTPLSSLMQRLLTKYSQTFNYRHARTGHLFQARYRAVLCTTTAYLYALIRYIHLNPVRAKLVETADSWPWSSYRDYQTNTSPKLSRLNIYPGALGAVDEATFDPWPRQEQLERPILLRTESVPLEPLQHIAARVAQSAGIAVLELQSQSRRPAIVALRREFAIDAVRKGYRPRAVAEWLRTSTMSVSRYLSGNIVTNVRPDT